MQKFLLEMAHANDGCGSRKAPRKAA